MIVTLSTWIKCVFTIRVCRNKQQLILSQAALLWTLIPPARTCLQHSGIHHQIHDPLSMLCRRFLNLSFYHNPIFCRKKLSELDNIQRYFSCKISTPTFPSVTEQDSPTKREERRESETDASHLLLKSNQLVGEVNSIISGEFFF